MARLSEIVEMAQAYGAITIDQLQRNRAVVAGTTFRGFQYEALRKALKAAGATRTMTGHKMEGYHFPLNDLKLCNDNTEVTP